MIGQNQILSQSSPATPSPMMPPSMTPNLGTPPISNYRPPHTYNPLPPVQSAPITPPTPVLSPSLPPSQPPPVQTSYNQPEIPPQAPPVQEVITHWFYENPSPDSEGDNWLPFSNIDSKKLENAFNNGSVDPIEVAGGRYIADLVNGFRTPVYWTEDFEVKIRRGGWYASSGRGFQPMSEDASDIIDCAYAEGVFPKRIKTPDGEVAIQGLVRI